MQDAIDRARETGLAPRAPKEAMRLLQGNQAIAEAAFYAGARFFAGYPITPSSEIADECARRLPALGGMYIQMEDEIGSIAAVIGAALAGAKAFTATSGPGFSLMQENPGSPSWARSPLRDCGRAARRAQHRACDQARAIGHHAGALGAPRRPVGDRAVARRACANASR